MNEVVKGVAVLFDTDLDYATAVYQGVQEHIVAATGWPVLPLAPGSEAALSALLAAGRLCGIIGPFVSDKWIQSHGLMAVPMVNVGNLSDIRTVDAVTPDDREAGRMAARVFVDGGLRHFGFAGVSGIFHSRLRSEGFCEIIEAAGGLVSSAPMVGAGGAASAWRGWLESLKRPAGVHCATDYHARLVVAACRELGRLVPDEVAVIGTGNVLMQGLFAGIGLSSIELSGRAVGREAARQLEARIKGQVTGPPVRRWIAPVRMWHRESSASCLGGDPVVARAQAYIRPRLAEPLNVAGVARGIGVSRRLLEMRFKSALKRSPYQELLRLRMEQAAYLLANTPMKVYEVGMACGFPEPHHFSAVFKRVHGRSPRG
ncbi:MAG: substrate-binding domain-containing protein [bacterium]